MGGLVLPPRSLSYLRGGRLAVLGLFHLILRDSIHIGSKKKDGLYYMLNSREKRVVFQNALLLQSRKLNKSGDFSGTAERLLSALGGNLSNPRCGSTKLSNTSMPIGENIFSCIFEFLPKDCLMRSI